MDARRLPARHGMLWLAGGFALFRRNPPLATAVTFSYLLVVIVINLVPGIGPFLLPLLLPALTVMLGNGFRVIESGRPFMPDMLAEGIKPQRVALMRLGGLHLVGSTLLVAFSLALGEPVPLDGGMDAETAKELAINMGLLLLLASPLLMAFWFAPLLTAWDGVPAGKSVFFSFFASLRNWRAFTAYGVAVLIAGIMVPGLILLLAGMISPALMSVLSVALRMLLIFVLAPTLVASIYISYRDVFHPPASAEPPAVVEPAAADGDAPDGTRPGRDE